MLRATLVIGLLVPTLVLAQVRASNVPPLPQEERFVPRGGLYVALRISQDRLQVDEVPTFTVVVRNTGTARVLVLPTVAPNIRIFDSEGRFVPARLHALADYGTRTIRASELIALEPGAIHQFAVLPMYHGPRDFGSIGMYARITPRDTGVGLGLTPGTYSVRFGYHALQDYGATRYDGTMPSALWEGSLETPPVPLTVLPLEGSRLTQAIAAIDGPAPAAELAELSQLSRSVQTIDAWLRRFDRNPNERRLIVSVIHAIGDGDGMTRLLDQVAALPERERQTLITESGPLLGRDAPACLGVPWLLQLLNSSTAYPNGIEDSYRVVAARCPELLTQVRAIVQSPVQVRNGATDAYAHAKYLEVLGRLGERRDVALLIAVLKGDLPEVRPSANDAGILRAGAQRGLASAGGEDAARALLDQLRVAGTERFTPVDTLTIAARLPLPEATPLLVDLLTSKNPQFVTFAVRALLMRGDRVAVPAIEALLRSPDRYTRQSAAEALQRMDGEVSLPFMRSLVSDGQPDVRSNALHQLARRGDASDLPAFIEQIDGRTWEPALRGIDRFGTATTFLPLKSKLASVNDRQLRSLFTRALQSLTFAPLSDETSEWDRWWASHSSLTRADWAREALANALNPPRSYYASLALDYLSRSRNLTPPILEAATVSRSLFVRMTAARIIGETDWRRAVLLLARELENRSVAACNSAVVEFNALTTRTEPLDCANLAERTSARARWTAIARE